MSSGAGYVISIGLLDCDSLTLTGRDERLELALSEQGGWTAREHAAFWAALLPQLLASGRKSTIDATSLAAALLDREGIPLSELGYEPGTIRKGISDGRPRPSLERGAELLSSQEEGDLGTALRRLIGTDWWPELALPRVWRDGEDQLDPDAYFNPMIPECARPPRADVLVTAERVLRAHWRPSD